MMTFEQYIKSNGGTKHQIEFARALDNANLSRRFISSFGGIQTGKTWLLERFESWAKERIQKQYEEMMAGRIKKEDFIEFENPYLSAKAKEWLPGLSDHAGASLEGQLGCDLINYGACAPQRSYDQDTEPPQ